MKVKRMIKEIMNGVINEYEAGLDYNKQNLPVYAVCILEKLQENPKDFYFENNNITMTVKDLVEYSHFLILAANEAHARNAEISIHESLDDGSFFNAVFGTEYYSPYYAYLTDSTGKTLSFSDYRLQHTTVDDD
jgi:hypothetical protein